MSDAFACSCIIGCSFLELRFAFRFWAREYPRHFENNEKLVGLLCDFVARVKREGGAAAAEMMKPFLDVLLSRLVWFCSRC